MVKELRLTVAEARRQVDVGRSIARIDEKAMEELRIRQGDIVEITGSKSSGAIALRSYPEDKGLNIIRMDGLLRRNSGVAIGEKVRVRKADVKEAKRVTIAPADARIQILGLSLIHI